MNRLQTLVVASVAVTTLASCGEDANDAGAGPTTNELGPIHVHALGVNPADEALYIATHTGMFSLAEGESEASRVGDSYQDTMGFTVVGPDRFLGSGHPDLREDLPPYLGLIESSDAGRAWDPVSLLGEADFHVLEAAGERIYGFGSDFETRREQFLVSRDGGRRWQQLDPPESLLSLAINPADPDELLMSGRRALYRSADAGKSWEPVSGEPGLVAWPEGSGLYLATEEGTVAATAAPGGEWQQVGEIGGEPAAFEAVAGGVLYAALHDGAIEQSTDGGRTWVVRSDP